MFERALELLVARGETVSCAESLTGGMLALRITDAPGASRVFRGGVVAYASDVKQSVLGVPHEVVEAHGVVSEECALAMARGVGSLVDSTWSMATTGVAGPEEQEGKPVGTVWIAVSGPRGAEARLLELAGDRTAVRHQTCEQAVHLLVEILGREEGGLR